jgi:hypothetical protein
MSDDGRDEGVQRARVGDNRCRHKEEKADGSGGSGGRILDG